jgi:hypothetical protein
MGELRRTEISGGLYERLLQRLALALDEADSLSRVSSDPPRDLELHGLTAAELELIRAYLDRDLNWLRGWHAAAEELAQLERWPAQPLKPWRSTQKANGKGHGKLRPPLKQRVQLCCALCGVARVTSEEEGLTAARRHMLMRPGRGAMKACRVGPCLKGNHDLNAASRLRAPRPGVALVRKSAGS